MKNTIKILMVIALVPLLASCAKNMGSSTYVSSASDGIVYEGVVLSARVVTIKDNDQAGAQPGLGVLGGGIAGGIGGSNVGKGKGSAAAAVGGAVAGAVIGAMLEDHLKTQQGMEYIVRFDDDSMDTANISQNRNYNAGTQKVADKIKSSTAMGMKSRTIAVVQGMENQLSVGSRVFIIYNDDRPRVIPAIY